MAKYSIGVIGIGFGQQVHVPAFRADPRCHVQAICASSLERAGHMAEKLQIPRAFGDPYKMIEGVETDVISIAVPPHLQPALIAAAARTRKHVFCEKPLAMSLPEAMGAYAAVTEAKVSHAIDFLFPEIPAWQQARAVIPSLGSLRHVAISWRVETYAHRIRSNSWKTRPAAGGGTLNNFVSHSLYYIEWLFGPIARLSSKLRCEEQAEPGVDAWMEVAGGPSITLSVSADAFLGSGHRIEVYGDEGTLVLRNESNDYINGFELLTGSRADGKLMSRAAASPGSIDGRITAAASIVRRLIDSIEGGPPASPGIAQGVRVQALIDAMRESASSGQWVKV